MVSAVGLLLDWATSVACALIRLWTLGASLAFWALAAVLSGSMASSALLDSWASRSPLPSVSLLC